VYGFVGLGIMAGLVLYIFPSYAKVHLSPMFVSVCFNFVPFLSQVITFLLDAQLFPGIWTTYGGACIFIGSILLSMGHKEQVEMSKVPLVGKTEDEPIEMTTKEFHI